VRRLADEGGNEIVAGTPDAFSRLLREDLVRYRELIRRAGVRLD